MARLRELLQELGYSNVSTYIASGNVILRSSKGPAAIKAEIEAALPRAFKLDTELIAVLVLTHEELRAMIRGKPDGFGEQPDTYFSDAIFLMGLSSVEAIRGFDPREGVDTVWPGDGVIYSQRLGALRTKSRLNKVMGTPAYKSMTIRNWATTTTLLELLDRAEAEASA